MIGLGLLNFELEIIWTIDSPILVSRSPIISLVIYLLGVWFPILGFFVPTLFFALSILRLLQSLFLFFLLKLKFLARIRLSYFSLSTTEASATICSCYGDIEFHLLYLCRISYLLRAELISLSSVILYPSSY